MPHTKLNFLHPINLCLLALFVIASPQVGARLLLQTNELNPSNTAGVTPQNFNKPRAPLTFPALHRPLLPPHFLPMLPFPSMPTVPSLPTMPSQPTPNGPSGPIIPSLPTGPSNPGFSSSVPVPPSTVPSPPARLVSDNPSEIPNIKINP